LKVWKIFQLAFTVDRNIRRQGLGAHADGSRDARVGFYLRLSVCLSVFCTIFQKPMQLDIEMFHDEFWKPLILGKTVKGQGHESQKHCRRGSLHSYECWLLLVVICRRSLYIAFPATAVVLCLSRREGFHPRQQFLATPLRESFQLTDIHQKLTSGLYTFW